MFRVFLAIQIMVSLFFCFLLFQSVQSVVQFQYDTPPESVLITDGGNRINGVQDRRGKDIILGGLFTIHNDAEGSAGAKCGERVWGHGIELLEAMFYALDSINSDPDLLPNITLGYDIRDTCQSDNIALDESVNLVFTNTDAESGTCRPLDASDNDSIQIPVAATIGPLESFISIPVASFFRLFQMSQVSYGSTSTELNNRNQYGYFFRTIPTNNAGVQAMIDIMLYYEWDHVSIIHSDDLFGSSFNRDFLLVAKAKEICIDANEPIRDDFDDSDYRELAQLLFFNTTANVIVLLASLDHAKNLLNYAQMVKDSNIAKRNFVWIVTDASAAAATEFTGDVIAGMWGIFPPSEPIITLDDYFSKLTASTNKRNPWYISYYEEVFKCTNEINCNNSSITSVEGYVQFPYVANVVDAVYSLAHAIHSFIQNNCQQPVVILLIASNVLAILTIRFPQNFNESKYVAFSTFSFGLMWIAFIFTYLNTADKFQTAVVSFTIQMSAMVVLLCLFALVSSLYCSCPNVQ
ncbi:PREDICTED: metabotropic glutamate receptor-like [Amphimedon queenslandica]|uniref:G-protein coupled receptors family 3 profile domain-containing protein n=1 Tax=Amphimedon queenslandica TaxID=400682 RepID=A0AAN0JJ17_AMPQE|nr:PREDICTED: metabotropic glutamate receptor-like [Amphimedon queenslandica]|eukprot:XP_019857020.1 PREDICTED: metabotropic glutamate receptor-like [Amphimedon queenslandica]